MCSANVGRCMVREVLQPCALRYLFICIVILNIARSLCRAALMGVLLPAHQNAKLFSPTMTPDSSRSSAEEGLSEAGAAAGCAVEDGGSAFCAPVEPGPLC